MSFLKKGFDFFIFSNVFIGLSAVAFTLESQMQIGMSPQCHPYLFLIFFATLFEYNSHKFVTVFFNKAALEEPKFEWIRKNLYLFYAIVFISVAGFAVVIFFAKIKVLMTMFPLGILTVLYSFPVYKNGSRLLRLREFPFIKIFIISFVWSATCIMLPIVQAEVEIVPNQLFLFILERFLFVLAITIPFDIRDMESDERNKLKTLPLLVGEKKALLLANLSLIAFILICSVHYVALKQFYLAIAFAVSGLTTIVFVNSKRVKNTTHYHYGVLDGTMLLQGLFVIGLYYLSR